MSATRLCLLPGVTPAPVMMFRPSYSLATLSSLRFTAKPFFSQSLHFCSYNLAAAAAAAETTIESPTITTQEQHRHPWPEWMAFVDHLKSQGYFLQASSSSSNGGAAAATELVYSEMNLLKDPCLSFARDRYDIIRSLPKGDIQIIVESGCPKLLRKVVNSAKRLRLYTGLDEQNVCNNCSLRGSCDRAYVMLKESDGDAQTVDLMRLLLFYALDPLVVSGDVRPPGIEQAEASARRLLSMFVDLSGASPTDAPAEPPKAASYQKKSLVKSMDDVLPRNMKLQPENWKRLNGYTPGKPARADTGIKQGDWVCSKCSFLNFSRNVQCLKCKAECPKQGIANEVKMKRGDWNCSQCGCMNFASRRDCFRCKGPRPPRTLEPGEWECPKCDFLNFRRNVTCFKCGSECTKEAVVQYEEQLWRKPWSASFHQKSC